MALAEPADQPADPAPDPAPDPAKPRRSRRKPADDAFLNPDIAVTGNRSHR